MFAQSPPVTSASVQHVVDTVGRVTDIGPKRRRTRSWACGRRGANALDLQHRLEPCELFYWPAVLVTLALATAVGDWTLQRARWDAASDGGLALSNDITNVSFLAAVVGSPIDQAVAADATAVHELIVAIVCAIASSTRPPKPQTPLQPVERGGQG